jgi:hypothetical protein
MSVFTDSIFESVADRSVPDSRDVVADGRGR